MYSKEADNVFLTRENIINNTRGQIGELMNAFSLREDLIVFTDYVKAKKIDTITRRETEEFLNEDISEIKGMWLKYMRMVYDILGTYEFKYVHPYKSSNLSQVTELEVYVNGEYKYGYMCASEIDAECQGYIQNFCEGRVLSPQNHADLINKILEKELKAYNYIHGDEAKFSVDGFNMLGCKSNKLTHNFGVFLFSALSKSEVLRGSKIDKLLD